VPNCPSQLQARPRSLTSEDQRNSPRKSGPPARTARGGGRPLFRRGSTTRKPPAADNRAGGGRGGEKAREAAEERRRGPAGVLRGGEAGRGGRRAASGRWGSGYSSGRQESRPARDLQWRPEGTLEASRVFLGMGIHYTGAVDAPAEASRAGRAIESGRGWSEEDADGGGQRGDPRDHARGALAGRRSDS